MSQAFYFAAELFDSYLSHSRAASYQMYILGLVIHFANPFSKIYKEVKSEKFTVIFRPTQVAFEAL